MKTRCYILKTVVLAILICAVTTDVTAKNCLWKVTSQTGTLLYLQGSIHTLQAANYPLDPAIEQAYSASAVLILETDINSMASPETQARILKQAMLPKGKTLRTELNEITFNKFKTVCAEANLPITTLQQFKPWFASMTLAMLKMQSMGFHPEYGMDKYFHDKAIADGKRIIGLESIDFQIQLLASLDEEDSNQFVTRALDEMHLLAKNIEAIEKAWREGDIDVLGKLLTKGFEDYPEARKRFITDRNTTWFKTIERMLEKPETHMVVIGAGHLPGKGGLLELLKQAGFSLEQL